MASEEYMETEIDIICIIIDSKTIHWYYWYNFRLKKLVAPDEYMEREIDIICIIIDSKTIHWYYWYNNRL